MKKTHYCFCSDRGGSTADSGKKVYEDGGTQTYTSLTYKVIIWKQIDRKTGTENFHQLDYYE